MRIFILLLICCFCFTIPAFSQNAVMEIKTGKSSGVIIPAREAPQWENIWKLPCKNAKVSYWTPAKEDVLKAEAALYNYLKAETPKLIAPNAYENMGMKDYGKIWEQLDSYKRQYVGIVINNRKKIYFNCFAKWVIVGDDWKTEPTFPDVQGGGIYQIQLSYDMTTSSFEKLYIKNGGPY